MQVWESLLLLHTRQNLYFIAQQRLSVVARGKKILGNEFGTNFHQNYPFHQVP